MLFGLSSESLKQFLSSKGTLSAAAYDDNHTDETQTCDTNTMRITINLSFLVSHLSLRNNSH